MNILHFQEINPSEFLIENYIKEYEPYETLLTTTLAIFVAFFGLLRLKQLDEANKEKIKQDYFGEWKSVLEQLSKEVENHNPFIPREMIRIRHDVFDYLYEINFTIKDKKTLDEYFSKFYPELIPFFENQNNKSIERGNVYPNENYAYAMMDFTFVFFLTLNSWYKSAGKDIRTQYIKSLDPNRRINSEEFEIASKNALNKRS